MSFGEQFRRVNGSELKRGQHVRARVGDQDLGVGVVDELTGDGGAVWIFFPESGPRRVPTDHDSNEFTVLEPPTPGGLNQ